MAGMIRTGLAHWSSETRAHRNASIRTSGIEYTALGRRMPGSWIEDAAKPSDRPVGLSKRERGKQQSNDTDRETDLTHNLSLSRVARGFVAPARSRNSPFN